MVSFLLFWKDLAALGAYCHGLWPIFPVRPLRSVSNRLFYSDYKLVGHVIESLVTDEFDCGLRCVRNKKCQSYNCYSEGHHGNKICKLNNQTRHSKPTDFRANKGFTYYGKGREIATSMHQTSKLVRLRQIFYTANNISKTIKESKRRKWYRKSRKSVPSIQRSTNIIHV